MNSIFLTAFILWGGLKLAAFFDGCEKCGLGRRDFYPLRPCACNKGTKR